MTLDSYAANLRDKSCLSFYLEAIALIPIVIIVFNLAFDAFMRTIRHICLCLFCHCRFRT